MKFSFKFPHDIDQETALWFLFCHIMVKESHGTTIIVSAPHALPTDLAFIWTSNLHNKIQPILMLEFCRGRAILLFSSNCHKTNKYNN